MAKFPRFEYKAEIPAEDGTVENVVLSFKNMQLIPNGVARKYRDTSDENRMWVQFEWGLSEDDLEVFDRIPQTTLGEIYIAWKAFDGVDLGESSASSASSTGTVRHSKQTSSETGSD